MLELARYMGEAIQRRRSMELMTEVILSAVCFRFPRLTPQQNLQVLERIVNEGTALLGPVQLKGEPGLRACIANHRTTRADIDQVLDRLEVLAGLCASGANY